MARKSLCCSFTSNPYPQTRKFWPINTRPPISWGRRLESTLSQTDVLSQSERGVECHVWFSWHGIPPIWTNWVQSHGSKTERRCQCSSWTKILRSGIHKKPIPCSWSNPSCRDRLYQSIHRICFLGNHQFNNLCRALVPWYVILFDRFLILVFSGWGHISTITFHWSEFQNYQMQRPETETMTEADFEDL